MLHGPGCLDSGSSAFYGALACATQATRNDSIAEGSIRARFAVGDIEGPVVASPCT